MQGYTSAVRWFAAGWLLGQAGKTSWDQVDTRDIQQWTVHLLDRYSSAYASIQFRALRQFFKWRADEDDSPDPMNRLRAPKVTVTAVPVFTSVELSELQRACQGRSFAARRDAAIIAVFTATGIRLSELAGIRCYPGDPARSDLDLQDREIRIRGKGRHGPDRQDQPPGGPQPGPLPAGPRPAPAVLAAAAVARREQPGAADRGRHLPGRRPPRPAMRGDRVPAPVPASLQPHLAGPRRRRTGPDGTQRVDLPADAHPVRRQRPRRPRPPQLRPHHGRQHVIPPRKHPPAARLDHTAETCLARQPASKGAARYPASALGKQDRAITQGQLQHNAEPPPATPNADDARRSSLQRMWMGCNGIR